MHESEDGRPNMHLPSGCLPAARAAPCFWGPRSLHVVAHSVPIQLASLYGRSPKIRSWKLNASACVPSLLGFSR